MAARTFANGHRSDGALDGILPFFAIFAVEVNAELVIFSLSGSANAHEDRIGGSKM